MWWILQIRTPVKVENVKVRKMSIKESLREKVKV